MTASIHCLSLWTVTPSAQLTFKTPKRVAGKVDIQVINSGGLVATLSQAGDFDTYLPLIH
ncbi:MAG: hypothetical protein QGH37_29630 [Candidatus Poribacteria bacterium]|nr:hypothetical protein [Candidatus Poribacteria bacterium]